MNDEDKNDANAISEEELKKANEILERENVVPRLTPKHTFKELLDKVMSEHPNLIPKGDISFEEIMKSWRENCTSSNDFVMKTLKPVRRAMSADQRQAYVNHVIAAANDARDNVIAIELNRLYEIEQKHEDALYEIDVLKTKIKELEESVNLNVIASKIEEDMKTCRCDEHVKVVFPTSMDYAPQSKTISAIGSGDVKQLQNLINSRGTCIEPILTFLESMEGIDCDRVCFNDDVIYVFRALLKDPDSAHLAHIERTLRAVASSHRPQSVKNLVQRVLELEFGKIEAQDNEKNTVAETPETVQ